MHKDPALQELATTPLMLSILTLAYHGISVDTLLLGKDLATWRQHIFAIYVQRMLQRRGIRTRYTPEQVVGWLQWLAHNMARRNLSQFYVWRMRSGWLQDDQALQFSFSLDTGAGLLFGLAVGLLLGLIVRLIAGLPFGIIVGLVTALVVGWSSGISIQSFNLPEKTRWVRGLTCLFIGGLIFQLVMLLLIAFIVGLVFWLVVGLPITLVVACILWLIIGLTSSLFIFGLGMLFGWYEFFQRTILQFLLWRAGSIPWNYTRFLDYAAEHLFLRKVGAGYIFIHRLVMEYFASLDTLSTPTRDAGQSSHISSAPQVERT
jgi:hypothetical protein